MVPPKGLPDTLEDSAVSHAEENPQQLPEASGQQGIETRNLSPPKDKSQDDVHRKNDASGRVPDQAQRSAERGAETVSENQPEIRIRSTFGEHGGTTIEYVSPADQTRNRRNPSISQRAQRKSKKPNIPTPLRPPSPQIPPEIEAYRDNVNQLARIFSHFRNVAVQETRHVWGARIVIHDRLNVAQTQVTKRKELWKDYITAPPYLQFSTILKKVPTNCSQRIIFVEDLNPSLIDYLGATFQIPPHVFEEHLAGSGYSKRVENNDRAATWQARSSAQGFSSITWYRPTLALVPLTSRFRARLVADLRPSVRCPFDACNQHHNVPLETSANIWRGHLGLCPEPGVYFRGSETEYPVGWEERATVWTRDIGHCKFVILLLDPLPGTVVLTNANINPRNSQRRTPRLTSLLPNAKVRVKPRASRTTELPRSAQNVEGWVAQTSTLPVPSGPPLPNPEDALGEVSGATESDSLPLPPQFPEPSSSVPVHTKSSSSPPVDLDSRVATQQSRTTGAKANTFQSEFSPAALRRRATKPDMEAASISGDQEDEGGSKVHHDRKHSMSRPLHSRFLPEDVVFEATQKEAIASDIASQGTGPFLHGPFIPYHPIKARLSSSSRVGETFTDLNIRAYVKSLQIPTSTLDEFEYFLQLPEKGKETVHDPFRALLRVIHDDTHHLVDIIRMSLQQIREGTMNEDLMQERVTFWRGLLNRLNFSLTEIDQRLRVFVQFTYDPEMFSVDLDQQTELPSEKLAKDTRQALRNCIDLLDRSSSSLLAEMQIVDSRRSIAEAESVSKLTELAFVFIPLSFVASLFSMQVFELEGGAPLYLFVVVAIAFVLLAYAVRLSIRSSRLIEYKSRMLLRFRDDNQHIQHNQSIPTHTFLAWIGNIVGRVLWKSTKSFLSVFAPTILGTALVTILISPIILLWLRGINKGFSAVITVLLLSLDVILAYPFVSMASGKIDGLNPIDMLNDLRKRNAINKEIKEREKRRKRDKADLDLEAPDLEGSDSGDHYDKRGDSASSISAV